MPDANFARTNPRDLAMAAAFRDTGICEICLRLFADKDLEDGLTVSADCCERVGLCRYCRQFGEHDCDGDESVEPEQPL